MVILGIFPWCFTPELYAAKPEYIDSLAEFVRGRPMPDVEAFLRQSEAVLGHDASAQLGRITAPTQVTLGRRDLVCSTRFIDALTGGIADTELVVRGLLARADLRERAGLQRPDAGIPTTALGIGRGARGIGRREPAPESTVP
jgi:pimeloyl-ACP methyl ester carboxylesterase